MVCILPPLLYPSCHPPFPFFPFLFSLFPSHTLFALSPYFLPCRFPLLPPSLFVLSPFSSLLPPLSFPSSPLLPLSLHYLPLNLLPLSLPPPSVSSHLPLFLLITFTHCTSFPPHPHTRSLIPSPQQRCSWETWLGSRLFGVRPQS